MKIKNGQGKMFDNYVARGEAERPAKGKTESGDSPTG